MTSAPDHRPAGGFGPGPLAGHRKGVLHRAGAESGVLPARKDLPSGWWIVPSVLIGSLAWVAVIGWIAGWLP